MEYQFGMHGHEFGDLGPVYGKQWRFWFGGNGEKIDQIEKVVKDIKNNPNSRRLVVSSWNVSDLPDMALYPCHILFQFYVANNTLSCQLYQRSADAFLGVPFNIASYSLLTHMIAAQCNLDVGDFIWSGGDCHIYKNHIEQVNLQLTREPFPLPKLIIKRKPNSVFNYEYNDFEIQNYLCHSVLKGKVAV